MMNSDLDILQRKVVALLQDGIDLPESTMFFAESTYGLSPSNLGPALRDESFEEREVLISLILTPGYEMRQAIEPLLGVEAVPSGQRAHLATAVSQRIQSFSVRLPGTEVLVLDVGRQEICYLIDKLYLDRIIDPAIDAALRRTFSEKTIIDARLALRCRGDQLSGAKLDFLVRFIECSGTYENTFLELFSLLLVLIAELSDADPIERHLRERQRGVVETIKKIRMFEEKKERYSMEYLMMQRYPVPHESEDEMLNLLHLLTTITETILGLPPEPTLRLDYRDLGRYCSATDIGQLINDLS